MLLATLQASYLGRSTDWGRSVSGALLIVSGALVGTNLLTAGGMYLRLRATLASLDVRLAAPRAQRWRSLIAANPGDLVNQGRGRCTQQQGGGTACEFLLWTIPPAPQRAE